jgi:hypothetical protein
MSVLKHICFDQIHNGRNHPKKRDCASINMGIQNFLGDAHPLHSGENIPNITKHGEHQKPPLVIDLLQPVQKPFRILLHHVSFLREVQPQLPGMQHQREYQRN